MGRLDCRDELEVCIAPTAARQLPTSLPWGLDAALAVLRQLGQTTEARQDLLEAILGLAAHSLTEDETHVTARDGSDARASC